MKRKRGAGLEPLLGIFRNSEYCRVFLGQRRGARRLESIQKGGRRDGGLKMDWTKPLARA